MTSWRCAKRKAGLSSNRYGRESMSWRICLRASPPGTCTRQLNSDLRKATRCGEGHEERARRGRDRVDQLHPAGWSRAGPTPSSARSESGGVQRQDESHDLLSTDYADQELSV